MTLIIKAQSVSIDYRFYSKGILGLNTKHLLSSNFYIEHFIKE